MEKGDESAESAPRKWWVYMILTEKGNLYTGIATDPDRRFREHLSAWEGKKNSRGAKYFRSQKPLEILYREAYPTRGEATRRETHIKKLDREEKGKLMKKVSLGQF